jgi:hypothetical protein
MTEQKDRRYWTLDEEAEHERKLAEQRRQWEQRKKAEAEQRERQQKQAELESYLARRSRTFMDHTGEQPSDQDLRRWQAEYLDELERKHQADREAKLKAAEQEHYSH